METPSNSLDISTFSFEEWIYFFFDRPVGHDLIGRLYNDGYRCFDASDPAAVVEYVTRLCNECVQVFSRFTLPQIDQGIWAILGSDFECQRYLSERSVPIDKRVDCIDSMFHVYADFVAPSKVEVMENCFDMWWHLIAGSFWSQFADYSDLVNTSLSLDEILASYKPDHDLSKLDEDSWQVLNAMFNTLVQILALDDIRTQSYALHGLGHLHHPGVKDVVQNYIDANGTEWTDEGRQWLRQCRDGEVM